MSKFQSSLKTYRRLLRCTQKYWFLFLLGMIGTILLSCSDAGLSWSMKPLLNYGFVNHNELFIEILPLCIFVFVVFRGIAGFMSNYFVSRVARKVVTDFRRQLFDKFLHMPASYFDRNSSGHLLSAIIYNVEQVAQASSDALLTFLQEFTLLIALVFVMFMVSWQLAMLFLIVSPLISWVVKKSSNRLKRLSTNVQQSVGDVTHVADECIQGYKIIRLYRGQEYEYEKFFQATRKNQQRELKIVVTNSINSAIVQFLISVPIAMTIIVALTVSWMHVSAGTFVAILTSMIMLLRPVRRLTTLNIQIQKGVAGAESIFAILDEEPEKDVGKISVEKVQGRIEFKEVEFAYQSSREPVLKNVNFVVQPNQTVAIVGRSGSGKTTLINLLPRFYDVKNGLITIDGVNINDYRLKDLRTQFALVSQNPILFNDTIANNIAYGIRESITEKQIIEAAEAAYAMEFIQNLAQGINTPVGENGVMLSGGQKQRIAIARALLKNAPILILDEATSALDSYSERHIQKALDNLMHQRTTLVIAHRLSTIENANWIIVMEKGAIVEQGTHEDLIKRGGSYALLHRMQFRDVPLTASPLFVSDATTNEI